MLLSDTPVRPVHSKLYGLDHLRALAILLVFLFHYNILSHGEPAWLHEAIKFGWTGVDLFFVLSGFLISSQLFQQIKNGKRISFPEFFIKRFFRIVPAFLVVVGVYFLFPIFHEKESLPPLWRFLTFTQNFGLNIRESGTFSHAWSLCVEEHFYLVLPILLIFLQTFPKVFRRAFLLLIMLFIAGFFVRHYSYQNLFLPHANSDDGWMHWYKHIYYPTYNRLDGLLIGVSIAAVYIFAPGLWTRISKYGNVSILLGIFTLTIAYFVVESTKSYPASVFGFPLVAIGYGLLVTGAISTKSFLFRWQSRATTFLATLSYSIYLSHKGMIHITQQFLTGYELSGNTTLILCSITCILGAILLHFLVEKPFLRLRDKIILPRLSKKS